MRGQLNSLGRRRKERAGGSGFWAHAALIGFLAFETGAEARPEWQTSAEPRIINERIEHPEAFGEGGFSVFELGRYSPFTLTLLPDDLAERMQLSRLVFSDQPAARFGEFGDDREDGIFEPDGGYVAGREKRQRLGGIVTMTNRSGLDYDGLFVSVQTQALHYDVVEDFSGRVSWRNRVRIAHQFGPGGQVGVFAYARQRHYYFGANSQRNDWGFNFAEPVNETTNPLFLDEYQVRHAEVERERDEYGLNLDWVPTEWTRVFVRGFYMDTRDIERRDGLEFDSNADGRPASVLFAYEPSTDVIGGVLERGTMRAQADRPGQSRLEQKLKDELETEERWGFDAGGMHRLNNGWSLTLGARYARREKLEPERLDSEFRHRDPAFSYAYTLGNRGMPAVDFLDESVRANALDPQRNLLHRLETENNRRLHEYRSMSLDLASGRPADEDGRIWSGGFADTRQRKVYDQEYARYEPTGGPALSEVFKTSMLPPITGVELGPRIDPGLTRDLPLSRLMALESRFRSAREDYNGNQAVQAFYWTEAYQRGPWRAGVGLRGEWTTVRDRAEHIEWNGEEPSGNPFFPGGRIFVDEPQRVREMDFHWLPAVSLRYQPRPELILRAQWSHSLGRPRAEERAPRIAVDEAGGYEPVIEAGNADLEISRITQFDLGLDWENRPGSFFSVGLFHHRHEEPIFRHGALATPAAIRARLPLGDSDFRLNRRHYAVSTFLNAMDGEVTGGRLNAFQRFDFLPTLLDGLGVLGNLTVSDSAQHLTTLDGNARSTRLQEVPDRKGNLGLFYQRDGFFAHLIGDYESQFLHSVGGTAEGGFGTGDRWVRPRWTLDFSAEFAFTRSFEVYLSANNLTNEPYVLHEGDRRRVVEYLETGREYVLGFQLKF